MTTHIRSASASLRRRFDLAALVAWSRRLAGRLRQRRRLAELDDRLLRDIGVTRSRALAEASKPWWTLLR
ncbi:MAG: DUF1127 domain-containing protein [Rhodospirillaceae bacterium]|nr:DUF1127 domain-containing protein [Rhodospirillaceae bacterium]